MRSRPLAPIQPHSPTPFHRSLLGHLSHNNPYAFPTSASPFVRLALRLLEGGASASTIAPLFRTNPFPDPRAPPTYVRTLLCHYLPASPSHTAATGEHWTERVLGLHLPPVSRASLAAQARLPPLKCDGGELEDNKTAAAAGAPGRSPLDAAWPLNDTSPPPEEWFAECSTWRRRAGVASAGVTAAEEDEAWAFLADLRAAAADAVEAEVAAAAVSRVAVSNDGGAMSQQEMGAHDAAAAATTAAGRRPRRRPSRT